MKLRTLLTLVTAITVVFAVDSGASQSQAPSQKPAAPQKPEPSQKPEKTGIAECDRYFEMVEACLATNKMSAEEKKAAEFNVNRLRTMVPIAKSAAGRETLVDRCTKSIELGQKNDTDGCYKTAAAPAGTKPGTTPATKPGAKQ